VIQVRLLGPLEVIGDDGSVRTPAGEKERSLLAMLALSAGNPISPDRLIDALWGDDPPSNPANALQARVSALRRSLGEADLVIREPAGYVLAIPPAAVDLHRFVDLVGRGRADAQRGAPGQALSALDEALALWREEALADFVYAEFARPHIARLEDSHIQAEELRLELMIDHGRSDEAIDVVERILETHPLRERLWCLLMLALYRSGRQAEALRAFSRANETLVEELGIEPGPDLRELEERILMQDPALAAPSRSALANGNLPNRLTSFLGREREIEEVLAALSSNRLVTLVGPGGVGKTSLAWECGRRAMRRFVDGVWLVELAAVGEPDLVADEIGRAMAVRSVPSHGMARSPEMVDLLEAHLRDRELLVILDNCEHLIAGCAEVVQRLLAAAPGVSVLATSREPLRLGGETVLPIAPMSAPSGEVDPDRLNEFDAVRLFVERARQVTPGFALDATTAPAVAVICERLDGLPLALELAAARTRVLPVRELAARLHDRFALLTGGSRDQLPRHQTLAATIDWSHDMLSARERTLFRRLSVFVGGWTMDAVSGVCSDTDLPEAEILDLLTGLVDRSLVVADPPRGRFSMLETIREYAHRQLDEAGEVPLLETRHAEWFAGWAESAALHGPDQTEWVGRLDSDVENLRAAMSRGMARSLCEPALRLGGALGWYWFFDRMNEGRDRLDMILTGCGDADEILRARALQARAMVVFDLAPETQARAAARESDRILTAAGRHREAALSKCLVALDGWFGTDPAESLELLDRAIDVYRASDDVWGEAMSEFVRMLVTCKHFELGVAVEHGQRSIELFEEVGDPWALTAVPAHLGEILRWKGDHRRAIEAQTRALVGAERAGLPHVTMYCLHELGQLSALTGDSEAAVGWFERGFALADELGHHYWHAAFGQSMGDVVRADDPLRARWLYSLAEASCRALGVSAARCQVGRAEIAMVDGDHRTAAEFLAGAVEEAARLADPAGLVAALGAFGRLAMARRDHTAVLLVAGRLDAMAAAGHSVSEIDTRLARGALGADEARALVETGASMAPAELVAALVSELEDSGVSLTSGG
jgi:predicted ATPase/DNA-binding SARP family transcriptional activator